jgi:hypothetical protein
MSGCTVPVGRGPVVKRAAENKETANNILDALRADLSRPAVETSIAKAAEDAQHVGVHPPHPPHVDPPEVPRLSEPPFLPGGNNALPIANQIARRQWEEELHRSTRIAIQNALLHQQPDDLVASPTAA